METSLPPGREMVLLLGSTASGKTAVSLELARRLDAEILSIDSMQVYRRMDIGTAKPTVAERAAVRHHMIDVAEPSESFSAARFVEEAERVVLEISGRGKRVLALAGTPLYLMSLMYGMFEGPSANEGFRAELRQRAQREGTAALHRELAGVDPAAAERIHPNDLKRIERALEVFHIMGRPLSEQQVQWSSPTLRFSATVVGIRRSREETGQRINARVKQMMAAGLVDEVRSLMAEPKGMSEQAQRALGYAQIISHLKGECQLNDAIERIKIQTRQFAKHQRTWFKKFVMTNWVDAAPGEPTESLIERITDQIITRRL